MFFRIIYQNMDSILIVIAILRRKKIFCKKVSGTYFFEGRKSDFSFVTIFHLFPSNFVPDARGPPGPIFVLHTTHMGPFSRGHGELVLG